MSTPMWIERVAAPPRRGWEFLVARYGTRNAWVAAGGTAALLLAVAFWAIGSTSARSRVPTTHVRREAVTIKVVESGDLRAKDQVTVSAINDKQILWLCPEGKYVHAGDTLVVFESAKYVISTDEAHSAFLVAKAQLEQKQNDLEAQKAKEEAARQRYESLPELEKKGFVMDSEVQQAKLAWQELQSTTRSSMAEVKAAQANVDRAQNAADQELRKLREGVMLAPRAGLCVYATSGTPEDAKKISVGMVPFQGQDLMYLPDVSSMLVDTEVGEIDLAKVKVGEEAAVMLDAYPGVQFKGEVVTVANLAKRKINRSSGKQTGAKVFDITVRVVANDPRLKPGLSATVEILCGQYPQALTVPLEAVFYDENEKPFVYVRKHGRVEEKPLDISDSNDRVAVVKNLGLNDEVLLAPPGSL